MLMSATNIVTGSLQWVKQEKSKTKENLLRRNLIESRNESGEINQHSFRRLHIETR